MVRLYILFASIYLLEGITEVPFILNVYLNEALSLQPAQIGQILFLGGLWFVFLKPLIGFIADFWTRFNRRWVMIFGLLCSFTGWLVIADAETVAMMTLGVSLKIIAIACLDVLIDGMIVIVSNAKNRSFIQSLVYGCRFGAYMLCSIFAGPQIDKGIEASIQIFYLFSLASLLLLIPVLLYRGKDLQQSESEKRKKEDNVRDTESRNEISFKQKLGQLANPAFGWLLLLFFLYTFGVDTSTYFDPILKERFSGAFLGKLNVCSSAGILVGIFLFPVFRTRLSVKTLFIISLIGWSVVEISCLGINELNGVLIYFFGGLVNAFMAIALLTVAVAMCKIKGIETFAFAFAISVKNLMGLSNVLFGGYVMGWVGITWLFIISSLCGLLPFLVLHKIDFRDV